MHGLCRSPAGLLLAGRRIGFALPAAEFGRMGWVQQRLGPEAIIYPGQQQHVRAAIQSLSGAIPEEQIVRLARDVWITSDMGHYR